MEIDSKISIFIITPYKKNYLLLIKRLKIKFFERIKSYVRALCTCNIILFKCNVNLTESELKIKLKIFLHFPKIIILSTSLIKEFI